MRTWSIIGKSFLSTGGQNPCEAIIAGKPVIFGPHMENFQPLARRLIATRRLHSAQPMQRELSRAIVTALDPAKAAGDDPQRARRHSPPRWRDPAHYRPAEAENPA